MNPFYYGNSLLLLLLFIWTIPWKIYAVWLAAKRGDKGWFVAMLLLNTFAILEIFYIFKVANKSWLEVKTDFDKVHGVIKKKSTGHENNHGHNSHH